MNEKMKRRTTEKYPLSIVLCVAAILAVVIVAASAGRLSAALPILPPLALGLWLLRRHYARSKNSRTDTLR